ncbi:hypothetical protein GCM10009799_25180 [Nocardiopsis rhodophaea]|uniref:Uncharacterized protein n=1 Tax=Nocardiopsis rhodophaea TaxID=280238 RepID=A0ABN2T292_9ACTN
MPRTPLRMFLLGIAIAGPALALGATPASAADVSDAAIAPKGSACRTHNPPGPGKATACRTWNAQGGGYYSGSWTWSGTHGVYVQGWFDGRVMTLPESGFYHGVKKFLTRGCKGSRCTRWS